MMNEIVDFHSHILPRIDDGSSSLEESISMLRLEAESGIQHVIATPHFYPRYDRPETFLSKRANTERVLRERMEQEGNLPRLTVGAEVYYFPGISESDVLSKFTIGSSDCILLEMPQPPWTDAMFREMESIYIRQGLRPIIAHVDRYISPFRTYGIPDRLADLPVFVQANANFFVQRSTRRMALRLLREQKIHLLGSDCHNLTSRPPNLRQALDVISRRLGGGVSEQIVYYQDKILMDTVDGKVSASSLNVNKMANS